jgi:hypothetical protein
VAEERQDRPERQERFQEANLWSTPIRDLRLTIEGTRLEPIIGKFREELQRAGIKKLDPRFYLSTEWGVPFETIAIGIPFYLAHPRLVAVHEERTGHVEGFSQADILRYLRHEMGHVVNYGYKLYEDPDWVAQFGSITQPYVEDYRPAPFSRRYVRHLPGWYAQKHPDEDWAETFAVWMTPGSRWKREYKDWPAALAKLEYCDRRVRELGEKDPAVTDDELDEDVGEIAQTVDEWYSGQSTLDGEPPPGLDGALHTIFSDLARDEGGKPAADLIVRLEKDLCANVFRWTGHFPERTRPLLRYLAELARRDKLTYAEDREQTATAAVTTLVTALAMNYVHRGAYVP